MSSLEEVLRQKEGELEALQKEVEALRVAARIMARVQAANPKTDTTNRKLSQAAMVRAVLLTRHEELHVRDISSEIKEQFAVDIPAKYLPAIIYRQIDKLFYKAEDKPNTFGLIEWQRGSATLNTNTIGPH